MKRGILYGLLPVGGGVAVLLVFWLVGKLAAVLCAAFYVGGWATHKHRSYVRGVAGLGKIYVAEKIKAWRGA